MAWLKRTAGWWALSAVFLTAGLARAEDRVLVLEDDGAPRPGLLVALRIQLGPGATAEARKGPEGAGASAKIEAAAELVRREHARLVIWAEGPAGERASDAVLYMVGEREGRALVEVVRLPGARGPDLDRVLALKVRLALDELATAALAGREPIGPQALAPTETADRLSQPRAESPPAGTSPRGLGVVLGAGVLGRSLSGSASGQWGPALHAGPSLFAGPLRLSMEIALCWLPESSVRRDGAVVRLHELEPAALLRAALRAGPLWLGLRSGVALGFVSAEGQTARGNRGTSSSVLAAWQNEVDLTVPVGAGFGAELGLGLQAWIDRQRYAVNGSEVADLGRLRPFVRVAAVWATTGPR